jgi:hypothetical protein
MSEQTQLGRKQLAVWLRRRFEGRVPQYILDGMSDEQLIAQYQEHTAEGVARIAKEASSARFKRVVARALRSADKAKSRVVSK